MQTCVFGGAGFIGSNLVRHLLATASSQVTVFDNLSMGNQLEGLRDPKLKIVRGNMLKVDEIDALLREVKPHRVYHLVANSDISASASNPAIEFQNTLNTTLNLAQAIARNPVDELVFSSSSAVYARSQGALKESALKFPSSNYGWAKLASEKALEASQISGNIKRLLIARFPNVTGLNQTHGVVYDLVEKLRKNGRELRVLGDGYQTKPYIEAKVLVELLENLLSANWHNVLHVNISPKDRCSVREIVDILLELTHLNPQVTYEDKSEGWPGDVPKYELDTRCLGDILPSFEIPSSVQAIRNGILSIL